MSPLSQASASGETRRFMINLKSQSGSIDVFLVSDHSHGQLQQGGQAAGAISSASTSSSSSSSLSSSSSSSTLSAVSNSVKSEHVHSSASDSLMSPVTSMLNHSGTSFIKTDPLGKGDSSLSRPLIATASASAVNSLPRASSLGATSFASSSLSAASSSLHQYPCPPLFPFLQPHSPALASSSFAGHHSPTTSTLRHHTSFSPLSQHLNHSNQPNHLPSHASRIHQHAPVGALGTYPPPPYASAPAAHSVSRP